MRWVSGGPDIPEHLVRGTQEGRVVFFCGAGVSRRAGLPDFKGLVEAVYAGLRRQKDLKPLEKAAFEAEDYAQVFTLLESAIGDAKVIRSHVAEAFALPESADISTHDALIKLATDAQGNCRLVTTNYDRCFRVAARELPIHAAPRLPIPRPDRWINSVICLHGFLDDCGDEWRELILTSADFGAAYLVDGWATRFLRELFQHFTVVFVGYSADDLVIRYMLQALSVDMARGMKGKGSNNEGRAGKTPASDATDGQARVFAFAAVEDGDERATQLQWRAKGIEPILYANQDDRHESLHLTLRTWADAASRGLLARKSTLEDHLVSQSPTDEAVIDRVIWALHDETGRVARHLAQLDPSPSPRGWVHVFDQRGLLALNEVPLVDDGRSGSRLKPLHPVTNQLARWLTRHLAEHEVLDWVLSKGGHVHANFADLIRSELADERSTVPLEMTRIWLYVSDRPNEWNASQNVIQRHLLDELRSAGWDVRRKHLALREIRPVVVLKRDLIWDFVRDAAGGQSDSYPIDVDSVCAGGWSLAGVREVLRSRPEHDLILADLLDECTTNLKRVVEIMHFINPERAACDQTGFWIKHLGSGGSSSHHASWMESVDLIVACLAAAVRVDPSLARTQVGRWIGIDCALFRRLACHAYAEPDLFTTNEAFDYVLSDDFPMWESDVCEEVFSLLARIWPDLEEDASLALTERILAGPLHKTESASNSVEPLTPDAEDAVIERLLALRRSGKNLLPRAEELLLAAERKRPAQVPEPPRMRRQLSELQDPEVRDRIGDANWDEALREEWAALVAKDPQRSLAILQDVATEGRWPTEAWRVYLERAASHVQNATSRTLDPASALQVLKTSSDEFRGTVLRPLSYFLDAISRTRDLSEVDGYWPEWESTLRVAQRDSDDDGGPGETPDEAVNTVLGRLAQILFDWIKQRSSKGLNDVPAEFWHRLESACEASAPRARGVRCLASMWLGWLFSINPTWTRKNLIPCFEWSNPDEAAAVWNGFLLSPNLGPDLWKLLKPSFLVALGQSERLSEDSLGRLYQFFARIVVHYDDWLSDAECQRIVTNTAHEGRTNIAWVFWRNLEAADEQAAVLWRERIGPWMDNCWQPDKDLKDPDTSMNLIHIALATKDAFPDAVDTIERLLTPPRVELVLYLIEKSDRPEAFPAPTLKLLDRAIDRTHPGRLNRLRELLQRISRSPQAPAGIEDDAMFRALSELT